ncbi:MAG: hypothetical protein WC683_05450 [bacterium]
MDRFTPNTFGYAPNEGKPEYVRCSECKERLEVGSDEIIEFQDEHICPHCFETETKICSRCHERDFKDNGREALSGFICSICQEEMDPSELSRAVCGADLEDLCVNNER